MTRSLKSIYKSYIDVIHFKKTDRTRVGSEDGTKDITSSLPSESFREDTDTINSKTLEKERLLKRLAQSPDIYEKLTRSLAPSIWQLDDIKKGILCQLFGGTNKSFT